MTTSAAAAHQHVSAQTAASLSARSSLEEKAAQQDSEKSLDNPKALSEDLNGHNAGVTRIEALCEYSRLRRAIRQ